MTGAISICLDGDVLRQTRRQPAPAAKQVAAVDRRGWSGLPEDLLLTVMQSMEVLDVLNFSAVCSSWHAAYAQFIRLHLPAKPNQPPCLLHARAADGAAAVYSPSTEATFPCRGGGSGIVVAGSAHGWVFALHKGTDDPFLLNPFTGARVALPPLAAALECAGTAVDDIRHLVFDVDEVTGDRFLVHTLTGDRAPLPPLATLDLECDDDEDVKILPPCPRDRMLRRVAISAGGTVLLVDMPHGEACYARAGDEGWTSLSSVLPGPVICAVEDEQNYLFYLLCQDGTIFSVDLTGPVPTAEPVSRMVGLFRPNRCNTYYLVFRGGELLLVTRRLVVTRPSPGEPEDVITTTEIWMDKVAFDDEDDITFSIGNDYALFLGHNEPMCLAVKDYPMLRGNCAYLADDAEQRFPPIARPRQDIGIWDFESQSMHKFGGDMQPWLDDYPPIWITPSLY